MLQTLTRAFLIPLLALTCLVVLWVAMSSMPTQANGYRAAIVSAITSAKAASELGNGQTENYSSQYAPSVAAAQPTTPARYTIYPLPSYKVRGLFDPQSSLVVSQGASIFFTKTVGTNIDDCFASKIRELIVPPTTTVTYCYIVLNTGSVTFTQHTIVDEKLGTLLADYPYTLTPYGTEFDAAYIPVTSLITQTSASNATWTAKKDSFVASASDSTLVIVPTIDIHSTVVANSTTCSGGQKSLRVLLNTPLLYCYALKNTSPITLPLQTVFDSNLGSLADALRYPLPPGGSFTITHTVAAIHSSTSVVTWTSATEDGVEVRATDIVTVQVPTSLILTARASVTGDACAGTTTLTVNPGSHVVFCYLIRNNGGTPLQQHQVTDHINGTEAFTRTVDVGRLLGVTVTKMITENLINTVTWRATNSNGDVTIDEEVIKVFLAPVTSAQIFIYKDANQNRNPDQDETGISLVKITLTSPAGQTFSATTNAEGIAIFSPLPQAGTYKIAVDQSSLPDNYIIGQTAEEITLVEGQVTTKSIGYQVTDPPGDKIYLPVVKK